MAVAFDAVTSQVTVTANPKTFSHACSGNNRALYVIVQTRHGATHDAVSYNGVALTKITSSDGLDGVAADDLKNSVWRLIAPASGSNTVSITLSVAIACIAAAISFSGVDQVTPEGTILTNQSTNSTSSVINVTSLSGGMVLDCLVVEGGSNTPTVGADQDSRWAHANANVDASLDGVGSTQIGATSVEMSWTAISTFSDLTHIAIPISPASEGNRWIFGPR